MKTIKNLAAPIILGMIIMFSSCTEGTFNRFDEDQGILPARFKIDIPGSISNSNTASRKSASGTEADTLQGNEVYAHLNHFIAIGEGSADIVQDIILAIAFYDIDEAKSLSFISDDDGRIKNLDVYEGAEYAGKSYEFMLKITDADSESEPDGGNALQVFWNRNPIEGVAILKPYNINREDHLLALDAVFRIEYSEAGDGEYETYMIVEIADMPMVDPRIDPFALNSLKMYVGKSGERIDVFGNSDHPNAKFFTDKTGFSWSFVASGYQDHDIAVAEVGLPPSGMDSDSREVLLEDYAIKTVLTEEINQWFLDEFGIRPDSTDLAGYLKNADAPGYFNAQGFVQGGVSPGTQYDALEQQLGDLSPFNPKAVNEMAIDFQ